MSDIDGFDGPKISEKKYPLKDNDFTVCMVTLFLQTFTQKTPQKT